jgi:CheY-like chemotaxis protein
MTSPNLIPPTHHDPRLVLVDGDLRAIQRLRLVLLTLHPTWEIELAGSGEEALRCLTREPADVIVCDLALPGLSGSRLLGQIAVRHPETLRVLHPSPIDTQSPSSVRFLTHYVLARPASIEQIAKLSRWVIDTRAATRACA